MRELIANGEIAIEKIPTEDNIAYPLTKGLSIDKHDYHMGNFELRPKPDWS